MRDVKFPHCDAFHPNWHGHSPSLVCLRQSLCQTFTEYSLEGIRSFNGRILTGRKYYTGNQCSECESGLIVCCRLQYTEASTYVPSICPRCVYCRTLFLCTSYTVHKFSTLSTCSCIRSWLLPISRAKCIALTMMMAVSSVPIAASVF